MSTAEILMLVFGTLAFVAIGSFTCVVIDRLPLALDEPNEFGELWDTRPWREVFGGRSRCSSCGAEVTAADNIPVVSWLVLRGRCRGCGERIPAFHPVVEFARSCSLPCGGSDSGVRVDIAAGALADPGGRGGGRHRPAHPDRAHAHRLARFSSQLLSAWWLQGSKASGAGC